jgi:hypothetical protein
MAPFLPPLEANISAPFAVPTADAPFAAPINSTAPIASQSDLAWDITGQVIGWSA